MRVVSRRSAWLFLCAGVGVGCSNNEPVPEEEPVPVFKTQVSELHVPQLLFGQSVMVEGERRELGFEDFEDSEAARIEVHEISPQADDGTYTATVSFNLNLSDPAAPSPDDRVVRPKVEIVYEIQNATIRGGGIILTYPVHSVKTLAIEPARTEKDRKTN